MASKLITDKLKNAEAVIAITEAQAASAGEALEHMLEQHLKPGEQLPDVSLVFTLLSRMMRHRTDAMVEADKAHLAELADDGPARAVRARAASDVSSRLVQLRKILDGIYGPEAIAPLFPRATPSDATALARFAFELADGLQQATMPAPLLPGTTVDPAPIAKQLRGLATVLENALTEVARENREAEVTLVAKQRAVAAYDGCFAAVTAVVSALLTLIGEPELAARVRPTRGRPSRSGEPAGESEGDGADEPASEGAGGAELVAQG